MARKENPWGKHKPLYFVGGDSNHCILHKELVFHDEENSIEVEHRHYINVPKTYAKLIFRLDEQLPKSYKQTVFKIIYELFAETMREYVNI